MNKYIMAFMLITLSMILMGCESSMDGKENQDLEQTTINETVDYEGSFTMPDESEEHEGTWLQWPHDYTYGEGYKEDMKPIWVAMVRALSKGENVHIVAYNQLEKEYIEGVLVEEGINMESIDFYIHETDDVWARDNGPIFVYDDKDNLKILDWGFNGWGEKTPYAKDKLLRRQIGQDLDVDVLNLQEVVLEGGSIELDGSGCALLTRSAVTNSNRNPDLSEKEIEEYISKYYSVDKFIWLDGVAGLDITDFHIDGFAKFFDKDTIITLEEDDLADWGVIDNDIDILLNAKNTEGNQYKHVYLPLTEKNVILESGKKLDYKGSYVNYYIANDVVLVPNYNDTNDAIANGIIQELYPDRTVIGIDVRELYQYGGMIHCVTQQQPN